MPRLVWSTRSVIWRGAIALALVLAFIAGYKLSTYFQSKVIVSAAGVPPTDFAVPLPEGETRITITDPQQNNAQIASFVVKREGNSFVGVPERERVIQPRSALSFDDLAFFRRELTGVNQVTESDWQRAIHIRNWLATGRHQVALPGLSTRTPREAYVQMRQGKPVLCGNLADIYVALCESAGLIARPVGLSLMVRDGAFGTDTHAGAEIWLPEMGGWVYQDPTFNCYWTINGRPASALQLHKALMTGAEIKPVTANAKAESMLKGYYIDPRLLFRHISYEYKSGGSLLYYVDGRMEPLNMRDGNWLQSDESTTFEQLDQNGNRFVERKGEVAPGIFVQLIGNVLFVRDRREQNRGIRVRSSTGAVQACSYEHWRAQELGIFTGKNLARNGSFELTEIGEGIANDWTISGPVEAVTTLGGQGIGAQAGGETYIAATNRADRSARNIGGEKANFHLILLAQNYEGYRNLSRLTSKAFTEGFYYKPRIDKELLAQHSAGLIALSSCMSGVPSALLAQNRFDDAAAQALEFEEIMGKGNYFLEIQEHGLEAQARIRKPLIELSKHTGIPLVATNDAHYLMPQDARAHDVLLCIGSGKTVNDENRLKYGTPNFYVRSPEEMWRIFGDELPDVLQRTVEIAERCELKLPEGINYLPNYPIPESDAGLSANDYFEKVVRNGYQTRKAEVWDLAASRGDLANSFSDYEQRLWHEIEVIKRMGYAGYFLIVWDFVKYAKEHGIPVGPGRGSSAGSLVAYCLRITDIDPLKYNLFFERFLNPERISMPDIDIDFCVRGRAEVINHVSNLYGRESVCQIVTFGTLASKAAIKDVGRALDMPYAEVDRISKMIPPPVRGRNVSIEQAIEQVPELKKQMETNDQVRDLIDLARRLEGCARHVSVHAAGVVITPEPLQELIPIAVSGKDEVTTQYEMTDLEKVGVLKMDFLALNTLTIISDCLKSIKHSLGDEIDWAKISLNDERAMQLFAEGKTDAIFQFESSGMQDICRKLRPKGIEDLSALNALYRPGPIDGGMVDDFILRHHGKKSVRYIVPEMKEILENTQGVIVYQEQAMLLAQKLAGYSMAEADSLRKAMGKKNREEMARQEQKFILGAVARGIKQDKAQQIFSLMAQFADYGFPKAHSVAYAYLAFQTAYLKAHYPEHFYAAVLSNEIDDTAKVFRYTKEMRGQGIALLPPDVNESEVGFTALTGAIRYGLAAIKGIGVASVNAITKARASGAFTSLFDFTERLDEGAINKRVLEGLVCSGAFDSLKPEGTAAPEWRARLNAAGDSALARSARSRRAKALGQDDLFGRQDLPAPDPIVELPAATAWTAIEMLTAEKKALGFYITGHPLDAHQETINQLGAITSAEVAQQESGSRATIAGVVRDLQLKTTKKGDRFAIFRLEDQAGSIKCVLWPEPYRRNSSLLTDEATILVNGRAEIDEGGATLMGDRVTELTQAVQQKARELLIRLSISNDAEQFEAVKKLLEQSPGECEVFVEVPADNMTVRVRTHPSLKIQGSVEIESALRALGCEVIWQGFGGPARAAAATTAN